MSESNKNNEEEVDLGSLFLIIGNGFSKFFIFIGGLFSKMLNFLILTLLFLKKNILKIGVGAIIGLIIGLFFQIKGETKYTGNLQVQPNFESTRQLYNNINYYNDLVKQGEITLLSSTFNITKEEAYSLKKFEIMPIINEKDILTSYDELLLSVDSITVKSYSFPQFKRTFTEYDYDIYNIDVYATKNNIFSKLDETIIESITENKYFDNFKKINTENLITTEKMIRKNLSQVDSLHHIYRKVLLEKAKKESTSTNIDIGGLGKSDNELTLFETDRELNFDLKEVSENLREKSEIINIISNFQPIGHEVEELEENKGFQFSFLGALIVIIGLLLINLNNYLNNYTK